MINLDKIVVDAQSHIDRPHQPVMLSEIKKWLFCKSKGRYLDCTFGAGGYSSMLLATSAAQVVAVDRDPNVLIHAQRLLDEYSTRFSFLHMNFADSIEHLALRGEKFDGIVMDLGVSSMQIDQAERGFSFMHDGPLDMRMSATGLSAADFINSASEELLADVIYHYGEETCARKIAKTIVNIRKITPITTTGKLASIITSCTNFKRGKIHPATKSFQAIRIYINDELRQLENFLQGMRSILYPGGRILIVSFHSLEDRLVKNFFREHATKSKGVSKYTKLLNKVTEDDPNHWLKILTKKPVIPSNDETAFNIRARSAKLRVAQKITED